MRKFQSPTLLRLILLGFLVVALPLVGAIVTAIVKVDRLARDSRAALATVQTYTSATRELADGVTEMERTARQYHALQDPAYLDLYRQHRREILATLGELAAPGQDPRLATLLDSARRVELSSHEAVQSIGQGTTPADLVAVFSALRDAVRELGQAQSVIARELGNQMPEQARQLQRLLLGQAALVIPFSAGLAVVFGILISRPLSQLHDGIRSLGRGSLGQPVEVGGTRDFEDLGRRLEWLRARLVALESQKSQFLRNVSHELKTPLTKIREGAELMLDSDGEPVDEEQRLIIRIVRENSIRLQQMIEELLRFGADGDIGREPVYEPVRLDEVARGVVEPHAEEVSARRVTLNAQLPPVVVWGNARQLHVIVDNLLSNAVRFTPPGGCIDVELQRDGDQAVLDVRDTGPGVAEPDRPHVFDWFFSGPRPPGSVVAGTGMGLAIAQEYARQQGGEIRLMESARGAHFRVILGRRTVDDLS